MPEELLPATFESEERADTWAAAGVSARPDLYEGHVVVPSKSKPGRFQVKLKLTKKAVSKKGGE